MTRLSSSHQRETAQAPGQAPTSRTAYIVASTSVTPSKWPRPDHPYRGLLLIKVQFLDAYNVAVLFQASVVIVIETKDPGRLWHSICCAARERRLECWEKLPDGRLSLFEWPTRHTRIFLLASPNEARQRLTLIEFDGDQPTSADEKMKVQHQLADQLRNLFSSEIDTCSVVEPTRHSFGAAPHWAAA